MLGSVRRSVSFRNKQTEMSKHNERKSGSAKVLLISNANRTECSPVRCVIIRVITKSDDRAIYPAL